MGKRQDFRLNEFPKLITVTCTKCSGPVEFGTDDSCPDCGLVWFRCRTCGWETSFGE